MKALVTRPASEAAAWVAQLQAAGVAAEALPLIAIRPAPDLAPLHAAWQHLERYAALMFVSGNAVAHFFAANPAAEPAGRAQAATKIIATPRCWATGPGTRQALLAAGVPAAQIDAPPVEAGQFDSESLWRLVAPQRDWAGQQVLIVRGQDEDGVGTGRPWLADQLAQAGACVDTAISYHRALPAFDAAQIARIPQALRDGTVWVFSSSQAIGHLAQHLAAHGAPPCSQALAVATHPRIAQAAREAGFGVVCESRPTVDAVVRSIKSLHDRA